jgi:hypothetical protein
MSLIVHMEYATTHNVLAWYTLIIIHTVLQTYMYICMYMYYTYKHSRFYGQLTTVQ